jgi:hypothetical protein
LPSVKSKEIVQLSPKNNTTMKEKKSEPRRDVPPELSGGSGTVTSSDDFDNQYDFEQIFDDEALSKEEEELFNQLKAREAATEEVAE